MRKPGVQKPHWSPCASLNARWSGCSRSPSASASTVRIELPFAWTASRGRTHGLLVELNRAGSADAVLAADVRPREPGVVAEEVGEERARLDLRLVRQPFTVTAIRCLTPPPRPRGPRAGRARRRARGGARPRTSTRRPQERRRSGRNTVDPHARDRLRLRRADRGRAGAQSAIAARSHLPSSPKESWTAAPASANRRGRAHARRTPRGPAPAEPRCRPGARRARARSSGGRRAPRARTTRSPRAARAKKRASRARSAAGSSAAGSACAIRAADRAARPDLRVPTRRTASTRSVPGGDEGRALERRSRTSRRSAARRPRRRGSRGRRPVDVHEQGGTGEAKFSSGTRLWPPASTVASSPSSEQSASSSAAPSSRTRAASRARDCSARQSLSSLERRIDARAAERVGDRVRDRGRRADRAGLADPLRSERVQRRRRLDELRHDRSASRLRSGGCSRQRRRRAGRPRRGPPPRRGTRRGPARPAEHLALGEERVDDRTGVVHRREAEHAQAARRPLDLDHRGVGTGGEDEVGLEAGARASPRSSSALQQGGASPSRSATAERLDGRDHRRCRPWPPSGWRTFRRRAAPRASRRSERSTSSSSTPKRSAAIWAKVVSWPWPCGDEPPPPSRLPVGRDAPLRALEEPAAALDVHARSPCRRPGRRAGPALRLAAALLRSSSARGSARSRPSRRSSRAPCGTGAPGSGCGG